MKPGRFAAAGLAIACCCACPRLAAENSPFAIYLEFDQDPSPLSLSAMQTEVAHILSPAAFQPVWRTAATRRAGEDFPVLLLVHFEGNCIAQGLPATHERPAGLASTAVSHGRVLPFTDIQCSEIRRFLEPALQFAADPETLLGKALGRILAHEMYHFLAGTTAHGAKGVARSAYRRQDLTADQLTLAAPEVARLRAISGSIAKIRESSQTDSALLLQREAGILSLARQTTPGR